MKNTIEETDTLMQRSHDYAIDATSKMIDDFASKKLVVSETIFASMKSLTIALLEFAPSKESAVGLVGSALLEASKTSINNKKNIN